MIRIYHVSDLHLHQDNSKNREALALLGRLYSEVKFGPSDPNYLLITGDIVDDGDESQYAQAQEALKPFLGHLLICPGNHDYGPFGNLYERACAQRFDDSFLPSLGLQHRFLDKTPAITKLGDGTGTKVVLYGLNSTLETQRVADFARGAIGPQQLGLLNEALSNPEDAGAMKLVYLHHRPQRCSWFLELVDSEDLMAVVHNRVQVLAFGHDGRGDEPDQARMMHILPPRPYGVSYFLNANSAVRSRRYYEILFDDGKVSVNLC